MFPLRQRLDDFQDVVQVAPRRLETEKPQKVVNTAVGCGKGEKISRYGPITPKPRQSRLPRGDIKKKPGSLTGGSGRKMLLTPL